MSHQSILQTGVANLSACHQAILQAGAVISPLAHEACQACLAECIDLPVFHWLPSWPPQTLATYKEDKKKSTLEHAFDRASLPVLCIDVQDAQNEAVAAHPPVWHPQMTPHASQRI